MFFALFKRFASQLCQLVLTFRITHVAADIDTYLHSV